MGAAVTLLPIDRRGVPRGWSGELTEGAAAILRATAETYERTGYEEPWTWYLAFDRAAPPGGARPIGACGFASPPRDGAVEVACLAFPGHEGRACATAMAQELADLARRRAPSLRVTMPTPSERGASRGVLERLGLEPSDDGTVPEGRLAPNGAVGLRPRTVGGPWHTDPGVRILLTLLGVVSTFFFAPTAFHLAATTPRILVVPSVAGLRIRAATAIHEGVPDLGLAGALAAAAAGLFVWMRTSPSARPAGLVGSVALGSLVVGSLAFAAGFFGPMLLAPGAHQGPLLGLFLTGPAGYVLGAAGGAVHVLVRRLRRSRPAPRAATGESGRPQGAGPVG